MAVPEDVAAYRPTAGECPWLWKAQRTLGSAEILRKACRFDCAANRYYFAAVQVAFHFLGERPGEEHQKKYGIVKRGPLPEWPKGKLAQAYRQEQDKQAYEAFDKVVSARRRADYQPPPVQQYVIDDLIGPVCGMVVRAMERAGVPRRTDD